MRRLALFVGLLFCVGGLSNAQDRFDAAAHAKAVAPYVDDQTVFVGHLDLSRIDVGALHKLLATTGLVSEKELQAQKSGPEAAAKTLTDLGVKHVYAVRGLAGGPTDFCIIFPTAGVQRRKLAELFRSDPTSVMKTGEDAIVIGSPVAMRLLENVRPLPRPEIAEAFAAAGDGAVHAAIVVPTPLRRALLEMMPTLPKELDAASMAVVTKGLKWIAIKGDTTPQVTVRVLVRAHDKRAAEDLNALIGKLVGVVKKQGPGFDTLFDLIALKPHDETLVASITGDEFMRAATPLLKQVHKAAGRAQGANNLKQIAIAMHNYYDTHKSFPHMASYDKKGKALLSWRVHLLPYVDQSDLYQKFKLDEPWDSEHNKKLIPLMPEVYKSPQARKAAEKRETVYLVPVGPTTVFPTRKAIKFQDITDGTSNTILIVEAAEESAVVWTKPADWKFNEENPSTGLFEAGEKSFQAAFADGSVHSLPSNIDPKTLAALFTRGGGEAIKLP